MMIAVAVAVFGLAVSSSSPDRPVSLERKK
jgi:hypothetical protein